MSLSGTFLCSQMSRGGAAVTAILPHCGASRVTGALPSSSCPPPACQRELCSALSPRNSVKFSSLCMEPLAIPSWLNLFPPHPFCLLSSRGRPGLLGRTDCLLPTLVPRPFYSILRGHYSRAIHSGGEGAQGSTFLGFFFFFFLHTEPVFLNQQDTVRPDQKPERGNNCAPPTSQSYITISMSAPTELPQTFSCQSSIPQPTICCLSPGPTSHLSYNGLTELPETQTPFTSAALVMVHAGQ